MKNDPWLVENKEELPLVGGNKTNDNYSPIMYTVYKNNGHTSVVYNCPVR